MLPNTDTTVQYEDTASSMMPWHSQKLAEEISFLGQLEDEDVQLRGRHHGG